MCSKSHSPRCPNQPSSLPTRVIAVNTLQLLDPSPPGSHRYIALSHCWGKCRSFLTTRANLEAHKEGFSLQDLPPTFRDAVLVTRALGVKYLWIDSVCIIQDDKEDWENEGRKMASIYANAWVTIAATGVKDDVEGFLVERDVGVSLILEIVSASSSSGPQAGGEGRKQGQEGQEGEKRDEKRKKKSKSARVYISPPLPTTTNRNDHLSARAWCLQERYLSPRILSFTQDVVTWECFTCSRTETARDAMSREQLFANRDKRDWLYENWAIMVMHYSTRELTYASDTLPALSGLVARVVGDVEEHRPHHDSDASPQPGAVIEGEKGARDTYLAGLWQHNLLRYLLWFALSTKPPRLPPIRPTTYHAPSWSWASYAGTVGFKAFSSSRVHTREITPLKSIDILEATVHVPGKNPYGPVESSRLRLRTPIISFTARKPQSHGQKQHQQRRKQEKQKQQEQRLKRRDQREPQTPPDRDYELFEKNVLCCTSAQLAINDQQIAVSFDYPSEKEDKKEIFLGIPIGHHGGAMYSRYHVADGTLREGASQEEVEALAMIHGILTRRRKGGGKRASESAERDLLLERVGCFQIGWMRLDDFVHGLGDMSMEECMIV